MLLDPRCITCTVPNGLYQLNLGKLGWAGFTMVTSARHPQIPYLNTRSPEISQCIPGAHLFPYYKSFSFTPVYHIKQHIHCSFLQVWDYDRNKDDDFLGRCHLDLRFLSTDHNTSFLIIPSRIPKKFYVPVTIAMEKRTADGSDWRG